MPFIALALVIAAALGGSTAALAQNSLPGDVLWGFKVQVNESVAGAFSASDDLTRANWDLASIRTRLTEAQQLTEQGKLTTHTQAAIAANITGHTQDVTRIIAKLQQQGDTEHAATIAGQYQAELATADASANVPGDTTLATTVRTALEAASNLSASVSAAVR